MLSHSVHLERKKVLMTYFEDVMGPLNMYFMIFYKEYFYFLGIPQISGLN